MIPDWKCPECEAPSVRVDTEATLVGFSSPYGHDHDDNCLFASIFCANGHVTRATPQRKCPAPGCDWIGKLTCFCHEGEKVGIWMNERPAMRCHHPRWNTAEITTTAGIAYTQRTCAVCGAEPHPKVHSRD